MTGYLSFSGELGMMTGCIGHRRHK